MTLTDDITKAANQAAEEFGQHRLVGVLKRARHSPVAQLIETIIGSMQGFAAWQQDNMTLVISLAKYWIDRPISLWLLPTMHRQLTLSCDLC